MLVDLGRNDINRVCVPTSTNLDALMIVEKYSHVMHIVSHVSGKLRDECSPFDAFRSIFPAGTVSGAPKVKAMEWIATLEKVRLISTIIGNLVLTCHRVCRVRVCRVVCVVLTRNGETCTRALWATSPSRATSTPVSPFGR
jgi:hypothetical protein